MNLSPMNVKKLAVFFLGMLAFTLAASAQDSPTEAPAQPRKYARPDIPGTFVLELGFNQPSNKPNKFDLAFFGSRTANVYYQYDMRILKSKFSFHPGVGFSFERYRFRNNYVLNYDNSNNGALSMIPPNQYGQAVRKSQLITNYLEVPLELRFSTNPEDPTRSFKIAIGARGGVLFNSFTKVKYHDNGNNVKIKDREKYNLNPFRYSVFAKIGAGNFSIFGYYNLTPIFKSGKGPIYNSSDIPVDTQNFTVGISLSSF
jgi:hypothetical protein